MSNGTTIALRKGRAMLSGNNPLSNGTEIARRKGRAEPPEFGRELFPETFSTLATRRRPFGDSRLSGARSRGRSGARPGPAVGRFAPQFALRCKVLCGTEHLAESRKAEARALENGRLGMTRSWDRFLQRTTPLRGRSYSGL